MREVWESGHIAGIRISKQDVISHLMFVNDLSFGKQSSIGEWNIMHRIINSFGNATGLCMNKGKYIKVCVDDDEATTKEIPDLFGVASICIDDGFTYLGLFLKPNIYCNMDWEKLLC